MVFRGTTSVFNSQEVRMLNQDDARTAINQMARYIRMATSSADNQSTVSNAIADGPAAGNRVSTATSTVTRSRRRSATTLQDSDT